MSNRTYPRYAGKSREKPGWADNGIKCEACTSRATCCVKIQLSWFRGDDESFRVCEDHLTMARNETMQFISIATARRAVRNAFSAEPTQP